MNSEKGNWQIVWVFTYPIFRVCSSLLAKWGQSKEAWCALMDLGQLLASIVRQNTFLEPETTTTTLYFPWHECFPCCASTANNRDRAKFLTSRIKNIVFFSSLNNVQTALIPLSEPSVLIDRNQWRRNLGTTSPSGTIVRLVFFPLKVNLHN